MIDRSRQLGGECLVFAAPDDVERRLVVAAEPPTQVVQPALRARVVVGIDQPSPLRLGEAFLQPFHRRFVHGPEQDVLARAEGGDRIDDLRRSLRQGAHVHGVGDGDAVEAQLPAQQVAQDRGGQAGRQVVVLVRGARSGRS